MRNTVIDSKPVCLFLVVNIGTSSDATA